ncbi:MAG TPA: hypothetical protein VG273_13020 [Bryobacteraceae bacterium]|nr:hypothetical protein [Bryobacteraceae bacterium]
MKFTLSAATVLAIALLAGCTKNIDTPEAVKQGVIKDISKKVDVQNMDVTVESVSFRGKEATANISFKPHGGDPKQSITMSYAMEKQGDEWHVKGRDMQRHEESKGAQMPSGAGAMSGGELPPGHPSTTSGAAPGQLPPGHPSTTTGQQLPPGHIPTK